MAIVGFLVFASALVASMAVFWLTLVPALPRIVAILRYGVDPAAPGQQLILSEARVRARVRTAAPLARPERRAAA